MSGKILNVKDTVNGGEGFVQIELNGNLETLFQVKNVEAFLDKNKEASELQVLYGSIAKLNQSKVQEVARCII